MGDLLMSLPVIHALRAAFPESHLTLLMRSELVPLLENHPDISQILPVDPAQGQGWGAILRWGRTLRSCRFDTALILNPTRLFHIASFLAGIPKRVGYRRKWGFLLTAGLIDTKAVRRRHEVEYNLELLELLAVRHSPAVLSVPVPEDKKTQAQALLPGGPPPVAIHPWTSNPAKALPVSFFEEVAQELSRRGRTAVWIGEPGPFEKLRANGVVDLTGKIPLRLLPAVLKQCALLISNDSGPVHVAAAVGTPTVVVAPEAHRATLERWAPFGPGHTLLFAPTVDQVLSHIP